MWVCEYVCVWNLPEVGVYWCLRGQRPMKPDLFAPAHTIIYRREEFDLLH